MGLLAWVVDGKTRRLATEGLVIVFVLYRYFREVPKIIGVWTLACPRCRGPRTMVRYSVRRYVSFFLVPVIPLDLVGDYYQCETCRERFDDEAMAEYEKTYKQNVKLEFQEHLKRLMVLTAVTCTEDEETRLVAVRDSFQEVAGQALARSEVVREFYLARLASNGLAPYPRRFDGPLDAGNVAQAIHAICKVASACGEEMNAETRAFLQQVASDMRVSDVELKRILYGVASS